MGAPAGAVPALAGALAGLETLGCHPPSVLRMLAETAVFGGLEAPRVIDLGCGRGEMSVGVAEAFGAHVLGVDLHPAFLEHARGLERTRRLVGFKGRGAGGECRFRLGDVMLAPRSYSVWRGLDLAMMLNVLPFDLAAPVARRYVRTGGYYLIDDALARQGSAKALETGAPVLAEVRAVIRSLGDELVSSRSLAAVARATMPQRLKQLATGVAAAGERLPHHRRQLAAMLRAHADAARVMGPLLHPTLLLVRRGLEC